MCKENVHGIRGDDRCSCEWTAKDTRPPSPERNEPLNATPPGAGRLAPLAPPASTAPHNVHRSPPLPLYHCPTRHLQFRFADPTFSSPSPSETSGSCRYSPSLPTYTHPRDPGCIWQPLQTQVHDVVVVSSYDLSIRGSAPSSPVGSKHHRSASPVPTAQGLTLIPAQSSLPNPTLLQASSTIPITSPKHSLSASVTPSSPSSSSSPTPRLSAIPSNTGRRGYPSSVACQQMAAAWWA